MCNLEFWNAYVYRRSYSKIKQIVRHVRCRAVLRRPIGGDPGSLGSVCRSDGTCLLPTLICARGLLCVCAPAYYNRSGQCGKPDTDSFQSHP